MIGQAITAIYKIRQREVMDAGTIVPLISKDKLP